MNTCSCHTSYYKMMKWLDHLKVYRASPVPIMHNSQYMKTPLELPWQWFDNEAGKSLKMLVLNFGYPAVFLFDQQELEKRHIFPYLHGNIFRTKREVGWN